MTDWLAQYTQRESTVDMFLSHRNAFLPSGLPSTDVTTQPLKWTAPRGSSPWKRKRLLSLQSTQCGPASPCCCRQHTGLVRHMSGGSTGWVTENPFQIAYPHYKLCEKMQAGRELRSGWKKWRVGDAQVATSHWRTACSRPWRSMCSRELVTGHHVCAEQSLNPNSWHKLLFSFELDLLVEEKASSSVTSQNCWT